VLAFPQTPAHSGTRLLQHSARLHTHTRGRSTIAQRRFPLTPLFVAPRLCSTNEEGV
jgi:hypothetical protein